MIRYRVLLRIFASKHEHVQNMVLRVGLEPTTSPLGRACSIQLSYRSLGDRGRCYA